MERINVNGDMNSALNILCNCTNAYKEINKVVAYHDRVVSSEIADRSKDCFDFLITKYDEPFPGSPDSDFYYISIVVNKQQLYRLMIDKIYNLCSKYEVEVEIRKILICLRILMI